MRVGPPGTPQRRSWRPHRKSLGYWRRGREGGDRVVECLQPPVRQIKQMCWRIVSEARVEPQLHGHPAPRTAIALVSMERPARFRFIVVDLSWVIHAGWKEPLSEGAGRYDQCRSVCRSDPLGVGHE